MVRILALWMLYVAMSHATLQQQSSILSSQESDAVLFAHSAPAPFEAQKDKTRSKHRKRTTTLHDAAFSASTFRLDERHVHEAVPDDVLVWHELPKDEQPESRADDAHVITGRFTRIHVPLLYGQDANRYGIRSEQVRRSYFELHVRKYECDMPRDRRQPVKHVLLVSGGPGVSGVPWIGQLRTLFRRYGRENVVFYVADHRGVHQSRQVVERVADRVASPLDKQHYSWKRIPRSDTVCDADWIRDPRGFEAATGHPLVAISCSNAARDLAVLSRVLERFMASKADRSLHRFFLHAESYGTQVATRTLVLLPDFYDAVLLEGLATMEIVRESAQADHGLLRSCEKDPFCRGEMLKTPRRTAGTAGTAVPMRSVHGVHDMMEDMTRHSHTKRCVAHLHTQLTQRLYSRRYSFRDCLHTALYELLSDDFSSPFGGPQQTFSPAMMALPLLRDLYYCSDLGRFARQVDTLIKVISVSVRGGAEGAGGERGERGEREEGGETAAERVKGGKDSSRIKSTDSSRIKNNTDSSRGKSNTDSEFVQSYINIHEAFDLAAMNQPRERDYCLQPVQRELISQCRLFRDQQLKMQRLRDLTGREDRFGMTTASRQSDSSSAHSSTLAPRQYYYHVDGLAHVTPSTNSTRIFVVNGGLDVKTPPLAARRLLSLMQSPMKVFFELENTSHNTFPCRREIIRAYSALGVQSQQATLRAAEQCVAELRKSRRLDWKFAEVVGINRDDWWPDEL